MWLWAHAIDMDERALPSLAEWLRLACILDLFFLKFGRINFSSIYLNGSNRCSHQNLNSDRELSNQ
jgi:hypothetical protein